jgi:hypothetical protein
LTEIHRHQAPFPGMLSGSHTPQHPPFPACPLPRLHPPPAVALTGGAAAPPSRIALLPSRRGEIRARCNPPAPGALRIHHRRRRQAQVAERVGSAPGGRQERVPPPTSRVGASSASKDKARSSASNLLPLVLFLISTKLHASRRHPWPRPSPSVRLPQLLCRQTLCQAISCSMLYLLGRQGQN